MVATVLTAIRGRLGAVNLSDKTVSGCRCEGKEIYKKM